MSSSAVPTAEPRPSGSSDRPPQLADEVHWYTEHTALVVSTAKWAVLGAGAGVCVGVGTRAFLWALAASGGWTHRVIGAHLDPTWLLPLALPLCVWLIRTLAPSAEGHGTEAVIAAVHRHSGRIDWKVAPVKLGATVLTLAFGGSVGKEGPAAQIGASLTSLFADLLRLSDADRRRLVICGISAGFASVFGTPISGALFGVEVLYLGQLDYAVIFPAMVAGIVGHLVCGVRAPFPPMLHGLEGVGDAHALLLSLGTGAVFGLVALLLIESMRSLEQGLRKVEHHPYLVAAAGGLLLAGLYALLGREFSGLGTGTIDGVLAGTVTVAWYAFAAKIATTAITLEVGGSGGILTPIFFIGATAGAAMARGLGVPPDVLASFGFVAVLAASANTPIAAAVMAIEVLPPSIGVYAALAAATAFLMVGHRSVYASQKLGFAKAAGLDVQLGGTIGDVDATALRLREGSLAARIHRIVQTGRDEAPPR